jgi:hypothetical protein
MQASDYEKCGYAHLIELVSPAICQRFLADLKDDIGADAIRLSHIQDYPNLLTRPAFEIYGHLYKPMRFFLMGLTPFMRALTGRDLVPTYDYLRIYREGDVCHVHSDRYACEHSLSLTLDYSDGVAWDLEVATARTEPSSAVSPDFAGQAYQAITMQVGDAVLYQGVHHRHGRTVPNPNEWSAHLFLHWVDMAGPYHDQAFDRQPIPAPVDFKFG